MLNGFAVGYFWKHTDISDCFHLFNLMSVQVLSYHGTVTAEDVVKLKVHTPLETCFDKTLTCILIYKHFLPCKASNQQLLKP